MRRLLRAAIAAAALVGGSDVSTHGQPPSPDPSMLIAALMTETPIASDLEELTDAIGGRPTGSAANLASIEWALRKFREAGIDVRKEAFPMPVRWDERGASATVTARAPGSTAPIVTFSPRIAAMPFSTGTPATGLTAPLVDGGAGEVTDFVRLGDAARGAFVLVETGELKDIDGLFREYVSATHTEALAFPRGVAGIVYMSSRPHGLLYRHSASLGPVRLPRHSRTDIETLIKNTDLSDQMKSMGMWNDWASAVRGRRR